MLKHHT
ncbi:hypothetical protein D030_0589A, partial [Vibrio parahaemolyticus AQ3810]